MRSISLDTHSLCRDHFSLLRLSHHHHATATIVTSASLPPWWCPYQPGAEMCGTLKNIVALAAGMVDGLGYGANSKAAILRQGLSEMMRSVPGPLKRVLKSAPIISNLTSHIFRTYDFINTSILSFSTRLYPSIRTETFLEACGMADLVATCYGGRNRMVSMEYAKAWKVGS